MLQKLFGHLEVVLLVDVVVFNSRILDILHHLITQGEGTGMKNDWTLANLENLHFADSPNPNG